MTDITIEIFPCLSDNYGMLVHHAPSGHTVAIDTPDGEEIERQLEQRGWTLHEIWNTHWHPDHTGGNQHLKNVYGCHIYGPDNADGRIPAIDTKLYEGDTIEFAGHPVSIMETPGHTLDHIVFYLEAAKSCFVGDTVFTMGCGKLFEGTPAQMWESFKKVLALPDETKLYGAHEYTLGNAKFAVAVDADVEAVTKAAERYKNMRERGEPTVPTTVAMEKATNPFWLAGSAEALGERRAMKDSGAY